MAGDSEQLGKDVSEFFERELDSKIALTEMRKRQTVEAVRERYIKMVSEHLHVLGPPKLKVDLPKPGRPNHTWILVLSDWHVGQRTSLAETGGLFEQSTEITTGQIRDLCTKLITLHKSWSASINIVEIVLLVLGDLVENDDMRPSQHQGIDRLVIQQVLEAGNLLYAVTQQAMELCSKVRVRIVGGNHDRTSRKPGYGGLGELGYLDTYSYLIGMTLAQRLTQAAEQGRVDIRNSETFFDGDIIAGQRCVYEHGASIKTSSGSYGGIGYYPIANAARRYREMLDGADLMIIGHYHQANVLNMGRGYQILNGALPASTQYVQSNFKSVSRPTQLLLDLHPDYGLVGWHPIYLEHSGLAQPGDYWKSRQANA